MKMVSIIIPSKNRVYQTIRAIKSCFSQTYKNIEIILVDDGSDNDKSLVKNLPKSILEDTRIIVKTLEQSKGGSYARNYGVSCSQGYYVAFLDSDDIFLPETIEYQVNALNFSGNHNCITYGKGERAIYDKSICLKKLEIVPNSDKSSKVSVSEYLFELDGKMFTPTLFMKRKVFDDIKFDEELKRHQDYGFVLRAEALGYKFLFVNEILFRWISDKSFVESKKSKSINLSISSVFLERYSMYMTEKSIMAYLSKIATKIAISNGDWKIFQLYMTFINKNTLISLLFCSRDLMRKVIFLIKTKTFSLK